MIVVDKQAIEYWKKIVQITNSEENTLEILEKALDTLQEWEIHAPDEIETVN